MSWPHRLTELVLVFGSLGIIGFGGPAAHIALMRREVVERRRWLTDTQLVDLIGITSLIPGPNSTELAMLVGRLRAGGAGLVVAGLAFAGVPGAVVATTAIFLPAFVFVALIGPVAGRLRDRPMTAALLDGVNAAAIGLIAAVSAQLGASAIRDPLTVALAVGAVALLWWGRVSSVLIVVLGAAVGLGASAAGIGL